HAASGTAVLRRVARRVDLKLANRSLADRVADARAAAFFGEERLVVVAAVDRVVVKQTGDAAEANQAKRAVGNSARRQQRKVRPAAAVDWQLVDRRLVDVGREVLLRGVEDRRLSTDVNCSSHRAD